MKGYRLYAEMETDRKSKVSVDGSTPFTRAGLRKIAEHGHFVNIVAVLLDERDQPLWHTGSDCMDAFAANNDSANSAGIVSCAPSREYLRRRCVRIDEGLARQLHPAMFKYLESP